MPLTRQATLLPRSNGQEPQQPLSAAKALDQLRAENARLLGELAECEARLRELEGSAEAAAELAGLRQELALRDSEIQLLRDMLHSSGASAVPPGTPAPTPAAGAVEGGTPLGPEGARLLLGGDSTSETPRSLPAEGAPATELVAALEAEVVELRQLLGETQQ